MEIGALEHRPFHFSMENLCDITISGFRTILYTLNKLDNLRISGQF